MSVTPFVVRSYVNLAILLISEYELLKDSKAKNKKDPRLLRNLTIEEFITAFHIYKRIHCSRYAWRRPELDQYEANLVEMSRMYGQKYYEYHKIFSQRCAAALAMGKKVSWAEKDKELLQMIIGGAPVISCGICREVTHTTPFCPRQVYTTYNSNSYKSQFYTASSEYQGFKKENMHNGVAICNHFNANGCKRTQCFYAHVCKVCKSSLHGAKLCFNQHIPTQQSGSLKFKAKQGSKNN